MLDQRSANGTFVNNQRIDQAMLQTGPAAQARRGRVQVRLPGSRRGAPQPGPVSLHVRAARRVPACAPPPAYAPARSGLRAIQPPAYAPRAA